MATKITVPAGGGTAQGVEVAVSESTERWSEFKLEDGTVLRAKMTLTSAIRVDNQYDPEGNPVYVIKGLPVMAVISVAQEFKQIKQ